MSDWKLLALAVPINLIAVAVVFLPFWPIALVIHNWPEWTAWPIGLANLAWLIFVFYIANIHILRWLDEKTGG